MSDELSQNAGTALAGNAVQTTRGQVRHGAGRCHLLVAAGDHRGRSVDGRWFGFVEADAIYGRAIAVYWRRGQGLGWTRL